MDFTVEFYEAESGACPVQDFLDDLKVTDPDDFAAVIAGLAKLAIASIIVSRCPKRLATVFLKCGMSVSSTPA